MQNISIDLSLNIVMLFFLVVTAIAVIKVKDLIISTILLGIFSLLMAAQYSVLGAPDVAITEAAVGAGISTILFLLALSQIGDKEKDSKSNLIVPVTVVVLVTLALVYTTFYMPSFGGAYNPAQTHVAPYYITNSQVETGIPNIVTSVLASYRGYDTLGEVFVVFTAAVAVMLLLGRFGRASKEGKE